MMLGSKWKLVFFIVFICKDKKTHVALLLKSQKFSLTCMNGETAFPP